MTFFDVSSSMKNLCAVSFLFASYATASAADKLTGAEIRKLVPATYRVSVADSVSAIAVLSAGGGISVVTNKGEKDTGRWRISGDKICVQFRHLLDHKNSCSSLTNESGAIHGNGFTARRN
jgi:hypothetical protein